MPSFTTAAALAVSFIIPVVLAGGNAVVNNKCAFDVAVRAVDTARNPSQPTIIKAGQSYSEPYHTPPSGGVSIKIAANANSGGSITQLEYTVSAMGLFYDLSHIDGNPFQQFGVTLRSGKSCPGFSCAAGAQICSGAYNQPDDVRTLACTEANPDTVLDLCTGKTGYKRDLSLPIDEALEASREPRGAPATPQRRAVHWVA